jgi:alpha-beta hydrolase superfamily lysophospholipase
MASTTEIVESRTGFDRFQRRWAVEAPTAGIVLVHGVAEHSGRYEHVGTQLAAAGFDVLGFDLRGHGKSGGSRGHVASMSDFLDDVEELVNDRRALGVPVVLIGHSLGGLIATAYAEAQRPPVDLLVLSAPALVADVPGWQRVAANTLGSLVPKLPIPNDFDGELLSRDEAVAVAYRDDPLRVTKLSARFGKVLFAAMPEATDRLDRITIPTYVIHGADDKLVPPKATDPFEALPNATRIVVPGVRHESFNEPEGPQILSDVITWINDHL